MTFKEYLSKRRITNTPQGDFTEDARRDEKMPDVQTWDELKSYVRFKTRHPDAMQAARLVWQGYISKMVSR